MISDVHLTGTTHCPERVFTTHNSTPHERKISTQNMTVKGTRNMTDNILVDIETLRYSIEASKIKDSLIRPIFNIDQIYQFERSVLMFKIINKMCPESLHDRFAERSTISKYCTRNKTDLQIPRQNVDFSRKSLNYTGLKTWNSIPTHIRV